MCRALRYPILGLVGLLVTGSWAQGQSTPYIGYVYPAGGQRGTTVEVRLGGQRIDGVHGATVTGEGVSAKLARYYRKLSNQEMSLLREQLKELKRRAANQARAKAPNQATRNQATQKVIARIEQRMAEWVNRPACASLSSIAMIEVTIAPGAKPGVRELRLLTARGVTNPLVFHVGQIPEVARKPMKTCYMQVLGKEALSLRKRPAEEVESRISVPCTMNGQIGSGEVNRYRFEASKGQRLVVSVDARQLIPYIADAVPGWFQPVLALYDAGGKEVAFNDDYRFKPDPTLFFEVPEDGEYVLAINDAIYRGREDFVYRVTVGEQPFVTSIFPLGGSVGQSATIEMKGWNLRGAKLTPPPEDAGPGIHQITASSRRSVSNAMPFALDTLPECLEEESNNDPAKAQRVELPIIVNGRVDHPDDWDVFEVEGRAGETLVAEVHARRLASPLDSIVKVTDSAGKLLAFNDDHLDAGSGVNTHHADSYLMVKLPADGTYYVHLGDTARSGGEAYAYRLRMSEPQPDFALRVVPSAGSLRSKSTGPATVYAIRKDGFDGPIRLNLKNSPAGFWAQPIVLPNDKDSVKLAVRTNLMQTQQPISLSIQGSATIRGKEVAHEAVAAEDRMQAFLWRHLVPAEELAVMVYRPAFQPPPKRIPPPYVAKPKPQGPAGAKPAAVAMFTEKQIAGRLRQLRLLYEEWLLTDEFYNRKVAECKAAL